MGPAVVKKVRFACNACTAVTGYLALRGYAVRAESTLLSSRTVIHTSANAGVVYIRSPLCGGHCVPLGLHVK